MRLCLGVLLAVVGACGPSTSVDTNAGSGGAGGSSSATTGDPLGWSCGDGVIVTGEYCFREFILPEKDSTGLGIGDLTSDGRDEIVVHIRDELRSYRIHDDGTFELLQAWPDAGVAANGALLIGDFDADGRRDLLVEGSSEWTFFRQHAGGTMALAGRGPDLDLYGGLHLAWDTDLDGSEEHVGYEPAGGAHPEFPVVLGRKFVDGAWVSAGTGFEFWGPVSKLLVADIDGDGRGEPLFVLTPDEYLDPHPGFPDSWDLKSIYLGRVKRDGSGLALGAKLTAGFNPDPLTDPEAVDVGDLDSDGHADIVLRGSSAYDYDEPSPLNVIYWGRGDFTFDGPHSLLDDVRGAISDLDGDGTLEIANHERIWVYSKADGSFAERERPAVLGDLGGGHGLRLNGDDVGDYAVLRRPIYPDLEPSDENTGVRVWLSNP